MPSRRPSPADLLAYLSLLFVPLLWVGPPLVTGAVLLPVSYQQQISPWGSPPADGGIGRWNALDWDALAYFLPSRLISATSLRSGHIPLWNPYELCGTPFLANVQSALLYPRGFLFWLAPTAIAFGLSAWLHLFLLGLFTYGFLRGEQLDQGPSMLGAWAMQLSGWTLVWLELPTFLQVATWLPLLMWVVSSSQRGAGGSAPRLPAGRAAALGGMSVAMMLLGGHLQIAFYCLLTAGIFALGKAVRPAPVQGPRRWFALGVLVGSVLLGCLAASAQMVPALELARWGHRQESPTAAGYAAFAGQGMPPQHLVTGVMPDFYGNPRSGGYWGPGRQQVASYTELCCYGGVLVLLLAALGLTYVRQSPVAATGAACAVVGWLLTLGSAANAPFYFLVPGYARFGTPSRALLMVVFGQTLLAAAGAQSLLGSRAQGGWRRVPGAGLGLAATCAVLVGFAVASLPQQLQEPAASAVLPQVLRFAALVLLSAGAVYAVASGRLGPRRDALVYLALLLLDLGTFGLGYLPTGPASEALRPTAATRFLSQAGLSRVLFLSESWPLDRTPRAVLPPNLPSAFGINTVGGYESLYLRATKEAMNQIEGADTSPPTNGNLVMPRRPDPRLLRRAAVRYVVALRPLDQAGLRATAQLDGLWIYEVEGWVPRPATPPLLRDKASQPSVNQLAVATQGIACELRDVSLVPPVPGWRGYALVDGREHLIALGPDWSIRAPAKARAAGWVYKPESYKVGLFLSLLGVGLACGLAAGRGTRRGSPSEPQLIARP
jgi:hypothetical protein